jgi:hypothetical protein
LPRRAAGIDSLSLKSKAYADVGDFLETSALDEEHERVQKGRRIGNYQIRETIAHGGMGAVYKAVRADDQYRKEVAIKLIRTGFGLRFSGPPVQNRAPDFGQSRSSQHRTGPRQWCEQPDQAT